MIAFYLRGGLCLIQHLGAQKTPTWEPRRLQLVFPLVVYINWTDFSSFLKIGRGFTVCGNTNSQLGSAGVFRNSCVLILVLSLILTAHPPFSSSFLSFYCMGHGYDSRSSRSHPGDDGDENYTSGSGRSLDLYPAHSLFYTVKILLANWNTEQWHKHIR